MTSPNIRDYRENAGALSPQTENQPEGFLMSLGKEFHSIFVSAVSLHDDALRWNQVVENVALSRKNKVLSDIKLRSQLCCQNVRIRTFPNASRTRSAFMISTTSVP